MVLSNNIRYLRKSRGWSQDHLAELLGYKSFTTIQKWETGVSEPPLKKAHALADLFGVDIDVLTKVDIEHEPTPPTPDSTPFLASNLQPMFGTKARPRLGDIPCGEPALAEQHFEGMDIIPDFVDADFTLQCHGDSMINARIFDGDIVCIRQQETVENGEIAAVLVDGEEATLKRVHIYPDHIVLEPENPKYRPLPFWEEDMNRVRILGKATYFISHVR